MRDLAGHDTKDRRAIGQEIREARLALGLTQTELTIAAECSLSSVQLIEAGAVPSRSKVLARVRLALADAGSAS